MMDFHSLGRRSLQALCKRNKIPANITNIAMADALSSLQSVEGLDQILQQLQTPIKAPEPTSTRPPNPTRTCRNNSSFLWSKKKRPKLDSPDSSTPKRSRTLSPTGVICKKKEDNEEEDEEVGSIRKMLPLSTLVPCRERSVCLQNYSSKLSRCSVELLDRVSLQNPVVGCSSSVRPNAETFKSAELALGGVVQRIELGEERRRSIGVQVDVEDLDNCSLDISEVPRLMYEKEANADMKFHNRCLDLVKKDHETTFSCSLPTSKILDKECIFDSLGPQNLQLATCSSEPCPESLNMPPNVGDLNENQETTLLEMGDTVVKIGSLALNYGLVLEDSECDKREFVGIHSNHGQVTNIEKENESSNVLEVSNPLVKSRGSNNSIGSLGFYCVPSLVGNEDGKKEFVSDHHNHGEGADIVKGNESSNVSSDPIVSQQNLLIKIGDRIVKSHNSIDSIGSLALNCGPMLEDGEGQKREFVDEGTDLDKENETSIMCFSIRDPSQQASLLEIGDQLVKSLESDDIINGKRKLIRDHNNHGEGIDMGREDESSKTALLKNSDPIMKFGESDGSVASLALNYCPILENSEDQKREFVGVQSNHGEVTADMDKENGSANVPFNIGDPTNNHQTPLLKIGDPTVKPLESDDSIVSLTLEANEGQIREFVGIHSNKEEGTNMDKGKEEPKSGGGTMTEIKTENQSEKRDFSGLSLRKLRLLYKENKQVIQMNTEGAVGKEEKVHYEEKQNPMEAKFNGLSLRKLKILYKHKATNDRMKHGM